jgi:5-methylcytosine-specific restriction protein A
MTRSPLRHPLARVGKKTPRNYHRWYSLPIWPKLREAQLTKQPLCQACLTSIPQRVTAATEVDHRIPHRGVWSLFVDQGNHQSLCKSCHSAKTARGE